MSNLLSELKLWLKNKQFKVKPTSIYVVPTQDVEDRFIQLSHKIAELEKKLNVTDELQTVLDFLLGIGNLEGHYFYDRPEDQGPNWWRAHLSEALKEGK
jgi:hypothetical protein